MDSDTDRLRAECMQALQKMQPAALPEVLEFLEDCFEHSREIAPLPPREPEPPPQIVKARVIKLSEPEPWSFDDID